MLEVLLCIMESQSYVHPYLVKQHVHAIRVATVWVGTEQGSFFPPFFFSLFSAGRSWMPSPFAEFSFGVVENFAAYTTDSLMFLKLTKLL